MDGVTFVKLLPEHLAQGEGWVTSQNAVRTLLKSPGASLTSNPDFHGWAALRGEEVVAIATVQLNEERIAYLECRVKPSARRQGIGSELIAYVLSQPAIEALVHLHAVVDSSNIAAQKTLDEQGFSRTGYASDGRLEYARHKAH